jgi:hypothetical protein
MFWRRKKVVPPPPVLVPDEIRSYREERVQRERERAAKARSSLLAKVFPPMTIPIADVLVEGAVMREYDA